MSNGNEDSHKIKLEKQLNLDSDFSPPTVEEWKTTVEESLKGASFEKLITHTYEGINLQPIYTKRGWHPQPIHGQPGFAPFLRGTIPGGYLSQPWEICQEIPTSLAQSFNEALKKDLQRGQTSIHLLLDLATQKGLDSDTAAAEEVGKGGTAISTWQDLSTALANIDIEKYPLHITAGFSGLEVIMMLNAFLKERGKEIKRVKGSIDTDPLGYMVTHGDLPISLESAYDRMSLVTKWACQQAPFLKTIGVSGLPYHNAGADAVRELAYVLATAVEYIDQLLERGAAIDDIAGQMRFTFGIGPFYFMEIAKLRAARVLWAKIIETCGGSSQAQKITIHARTSSYNQTKYDPYVNMLRTTTEAFSAVTAGLDSLHTNPFNEVFGSSDEFSRRVTRNTQVLLLEECRLDQLIDPAGGSYYVEKLTHEVCQKAWDKFQEIEAMGGMFKALQKGFPQDETAAVHEKRKQDIINKKSIIVGTNYSANVNEKKPGDNFPDYEEIYRVRKKYLTKYRNSRSSIQETKIETKLSPAKTLDASNSEEIIQAGTEAFLAGATIGEINEKFLRGGPGGAVFIKSAPPGRAVESFEQMRDRENSHE
ncbi:MAG: acyl-CoA mutase large subunit family protein [Candidatus Aminicenantes bacterium]|jgi:methylmalonyl-CoA mutase